MDLPPRELVASARRDRALRVRTAGEDAVPFEREERFRLKEKESFIADSPEKVLDRVRP